MKSKLNKIHQQDCIVGMRKLPEGCIDLAFADPPFNIGYAYDKYDDSRECDEYLDWSREWLSEVIRVLKADGTFWLAIGDEYAAELKVMMTRELGLTCRSWVIWYYTFGVNCKNKFSRSHAHLFHMVKDPKQFTFNADDPAIRIPSARQLVYGDKRANPKGRLPDDTWILRPQDIPESFQGDEDTWYFPRVNGTFKERKGWHGCQMPEQLLGRIVRSCSNEEDTILDPFGGSGTTLAVAKKLGREFIGFELSEEYVAQARKRLKSVKAGDLLDGVADPLRSAPATEEGRRLEGRKRVKKSAVLKTTVKKVQVPGKPQKTDNAVDLQRVVWESFGRTHKGYSSDYVIANPELNAAFVDECLSFGVSDNVADFNRMLMRLRKAGKLTVKASKKSHLPNNQTDEYIFASEIATRKMIDKGYTLDDVLCDPSLANGFDKIAALFAPGFSSLEYRWGAFRLRKAYHQREKSYQAIEEEILRKRGFLAGDISDLNVRLIPDEPGVYRVSDQAKRDVFVGATKNLRNRLFFQFSELARSPWHAHGGVLTVRIIPGVRRTSQKNGLLGFLIAKRQPILNVCSGSSLTG